MPEARLRRSLLMSPGNRPERLAKTPKLAADGVVFDLEDSVPPEAKDGARETVVGALGELEFGWRERCVRINGLGTPWAEGDLWSLPWPRVDSIMVPKVESAAMLRDLDARLDALGVDRGRERPVELIVTLETPRGVLRALEIADASKRTSAIFFGSGDYTSAIGSAVTPTALHFPRATIVAAAAAAGLQAIDAAYFADVKDGEATRRDAVIAREHGFAGKVVFHPSQIAPVNETFAPTGEDIARAGRIIAAYGESLKRGHGTAVTDGGIFVAVDLVAPAERTLRIAEQIARQAPPPAPSS